jgi:hypothetical protein
VCVCLYSLSVGVLDNIKYGEHSIIPLREENLNGSFVCYNEIDECIKRQYHTILLAAMRCIYALYTAEKAHIGKRPAPEAKLKEYTSMAQRLVTFAGLIKMPGGGGDLMRLELMMR